MSEDQGTPEERPKPPPPPPPRMAPPPPPKHAAAPAAAEETPPREPDPAPEPTPDPTPDPAPAPMPEPAPEAAGPAQTAAVETPEKPKQKASTAKKRSAGSLVRSLIWIVVLALIAWGIYAYIHHKNSSDDNAPTRTVVVLPKQLLGADRVVSPADRKLRKELNTHLFKQDAKAQVADYVATVDGRKQVSFAVTGFTGDPGGTLDYGPSSVKVVLKHFLLDVTAKGLHKVGAKSGGVLTKCGTVAQSGQDVRACIWMGPGRAALVTFPQGGATAKIAAQTQKIRAAVEHSEPDSD